MSFAICVPYRSDGGGVRDDLWKFARSWWEGHFPECSIITADTGDEQFCRARSVNKAVAEAQLRGWSGAFVIADADTVMLDSTYVQESVDLANAQRSLVFSHQYRWMLGHLDTASVLSHQCMSPIIDHETTHHENTWSGVFAVNPGLWADVGGFDHRFQGWGFEDLSFVYACGTLGTVERVGGTCTHLCHPRKKEEEEEQPHYLDNWALWQRYMSVNGNPEAMAELIAEGRQ
jgi:hypothetical protein